MDITTFILSVIIVTASGALAPGPMFFANITQGIKYGARSGLAFSVAHSIIEFAIVILLAIGVFSIAHEASIKLIIGLAGGLALIAFGIFQIHETVNPKLLSERKMGKLGNPLILGAIFTGLNPYFILWWLTAGVKLISDAWMLGLSWLGIGIMYLAHVWMDYVWLVATAYLAKKGTTVIGSKGYRIALIGFGLLVICFGFYFLISSL
jgi:threonine/homoserine/homoserine lactone efflux protein